MKIRKRVAMALTFSLGALLFATTALADISTKSGYEQLKDSLKLTAHNLANNYDSFTLDYSAVFKDNGTVLQSETSTEKYDMKNKASETKSQSTELGQLGREYYHYEDKSSFIYYHSFDDIYHVIEYTSEGKGPSFDNPFEEEEAGDIEKIIDALVGSLKDQVGVNETAEGKKELYGTLNDAQIPALVNAVVSFLVKQEFNGIGTYKLNLTEDVYVKSVEGKAVVNQEGILENIFGSIIISGKDKNGQVHDLSFEFLIQLYDINNTTVEKPDLTGKKVEKEIQDRYATPKIGNPEKFVGKYVNDIIAVKDGKFVKAGQRVIEIEQMDGNTVKGRYYETYKPEYENYTILADEFEFTATIDESDPHHARFNDLSKDISGLDSIYFDEYRASLFLSADTSGIRDLNFDGEFRMILD